MTTNGRRRSVAVVALIAVLIWPMSGRAEEVSHHLVADVSGEGTIDVQDYHLIGLPWLMPDNGDPLVTAEPDSPAAKAILETASRIIAQSPRDLPMIQETPAVPPAAPKLGANARELPVLQ